MTPILRSIAPLSLALLAWLGTAPMAAQAACPTWPTAQRFVLNGAEATDTRTGLVWARCSVGQSWSGSTCTGTVTNMAHEAALILAQAQSGWRLPTVKELTTLADKGCINPAIDTTAFPSTPDVYYWSSSPHASRGNNAWGVNFRYGAVDGNLRDGNLAVRLIRAR